MLFSDCVCLFLVPKFLIYQDTLSGACEPKGSHFLFYTCVRWCGGAVKGAESARNGAPAPTTQVPPTVRAGGGFFPVDPRLCRASVRGRVVRPHTSLGEHPPLMGGRGVITYRYAHTQVSALSNHTKYLFCTPLWGLQ